MGETLTEATRAESGLSTGGSVHSVGVSTPGNITDGASALWRWQSFEEGLLAALAEHKIVYFQTQRSDRPKEGSSSLAAPSDGGAPQNEGIGGAGPTASGERNSTSRPDENEAANGENLATTLSSDLEDLAAVAHSPASSACSDPLSQMALASGALVDLKKRVLSATDFSSQLWCERQTELYIRSGRRKKTTAAMKEGKETSTSAKTFVCASCFHSRSSLRSNNSVSGSEQHLEIERRFHEFYSVMVDTAEEALAFRFVNTLLQLQQLLRRGSCRELFVLGDALNAFTDALQEEAREGDSVLIRGIIDEVRVEPSSSGRSLATRVQRGGALPVRCTCSLCVKCRCLLCTQSDFQENAVLLISDTKTRRQKTTPSLSQKQTAGIQLQGLVENAYGAKFDEPLKHPLLIEALEFCSKELENLHCAISGTAVNDDAEMHFSPSPQVQHRETWRLSDVAELTQKVASRLPPVADKMELVYECGAGVFAYSLRELLDWWKGARLTEPLMTSEGWKCKLCEFVGFCEDSPLPPAQREEAAKRQTEEERFLNECSAKDAKTEPPSRPVSVPPQENSRELVCRSDASTQKLKTMFTDSSDQAARPPDSISATGPKVQHISMKKEETSSLASAFTRLQKPSRPKAASWSFASVAASSSSAALRQFLSNSTSNPEEAAGNSDESPRAVAFSGLRVSVKGRSDGSSSDISQKPASSKLKRKSHTAQRSGTQSRKPRITDFFATEK